MISLLTLLLLAVAIAVVNDVSEAIGRKLGACPNCGYYCTGKTVWCWKYRALADEEGGG